MKRLRPVITECRNVLESSILAHASAARRARMSDTTVEAYGREMALALLIDLAVLRCLEVRSGASASCLAGRPRWPAIRSRLVRQRRQLQARIPFPLDWIDLSGLALSEAALAVLSEHFLHSVPPDEWRGDHVLGWVYESFQAGSLEQKRHGRFYTPEPVAEAIVAQACDLLPRPPGASGRPAALPAVLDLGCGCGAFTLHVFDRLFAALQARGAAGRNPAGRIAAQSLFLVDNDPRACGIAALSLYLKAVALDAACRLPRLNIVCADALQRVDSAEAVDDALFRKIFTKRYDVVVGNPPYRVVNQLRAPQALVRVYKTYQSAAYKINIFALFVERGIELLKTRGVLGMVMPNTVLTQVYFEPLRRYILNTCEVARILDTKRVFSTAFVENCIMLVQRQDSAARRSRTRVECVTTQWRGADAAASAGEAAHRITQRHFEQAPFLMFRVHCDEALSDILEQIAGGAPTLGEICESHDGVNPGNARQKLIVPDPHGAHCHKVLNGKNIRRYQVQWDGLYVRYDRAVLTPGDNVRWGHREALDGAKILTRQTADRIIGAYDAGEYYVTNSVHTTVMRPDYADMPLKYVLALLNSRLLSWYYRRLCPEVGQVFSQVKLVNLRQLPIRLAPPERRQEIVALADCLLDAHAALPDAGSDTPEAPHARRRVQDLEARLDRLVYAAYDLSPRQIRAIEGD